MKYYSTLSLSKFISLLIWLMGNNLMKICIFWILSDVKLIHLLSNYNSWFPIFSSISILQKFIFIYFQISSEIIRISRILFDSDNSSRMSKATFPENEQRKIHTLKIKEMCKRKDAAYECDERRQYTMIWNIMRSTMRMYMLGYSQNPH